MLRILNGALAALLLAVALAPAHAADEDGHELWLRYRPLAQAEQTKLQQHARTIVYAGQATPTVTAAIDELRRGVKGMTGKEPASAAQPADGALVLAEADKLPQGFNAEGVAQLGKEGYLLRRATLNGKRVTVIAANDDIGLLYGSYAWLRAIGSGQAPDRIDERSAPKLQLRVLNHWDNLDRTVERGYAGQSIWNWWELPDIRERRYVDYARANASLGINGTVLNNVNSKPEILTAPWIAKVAALADVLRPYGIKVYLSARFSTPLELKQTKTADPLAPEVAAWWKAKADEIYRTIPDFGGFLVKANSEGQPGPQDYHRTHVDGANMLAAAVAPHNGIVMWRAFVYAAEKPDDRAKQAYDEFKPLDGKFAPNVLVQVKNGAIDFQPREPFHPLFGAMPHTPLMMEFQITKEYLGFATHLVYLGPLFEEVLRADTHRRGAGPTVAETLAGIAGVANIGNDRTWTGSHFDQANWYAFGRLAWNPQASARDIAADWAAMTFSPDPAVVQPIVGMMMGSREAAVNYMTPLGLHHLMARGHHYGPGPWVDGGPRADWTSVYYHRADRNGIGFDRTASGSNAVAQYAPDVAATYADPAKVPEPLLLWFHHVPWDHRMASGRTLWDELVSRYSLGVRQVQAMQATWATLAPPPANADAAASATERAHVTEPVPVARGSAPLAGSIDPQRHAQIAAYLQIQLREAQWWRDASVAYFQSISGRPLPPGEPAPPHPLAYYEALRFPSAPGDGR